MKPCTRNTHTGSSLFKMKTLLFIVFLSCSVSVGEGTAADDCDTCTTTWKNSTDCAKIKTYISCLIDTYETNSTLAGCTDIKKKMDEAKGSYDTNCKETLATDTCLCEVAYYQSALDCTALKNEMHCLDAAIGKACDDTEKSNEIAVKVAGLIVDTDAVKCKSDLTKTCKCQMDYAKTDVTDTTIKCKALKMKIHCLVKADDLACDGKVKRSEVANATDQLIGGATDNCRTGLTETCKCAINYTMTTTANQAQICEAAKAAELCVNGTTDNACDGDTTSIIYLNVTMKPLVEQACSGTGIMLSASVAAGYLLILFQMFLE